MTEPKDLGSWDKENCAVTLRVIYVKTRCSIFPYEGEEAKIFTLCILKPKEFSMEKEMRDARIYAGFVCWIFIFLLCDRYLCSMETIFHLSICLHRHTIVGWDHKRSTTATSSTCYDTEHSDPSQHLFLVHKFICVTPSATSNKRKVNAGWQ